MDPVELLLLVGTEERADFSTGALEDLVHITMGPLHNGAEFRFLSAVGRRGAWDDLGAGPAVPA